MHPDQQAIRQLIADWLTASKQGDTQKVLGMMSEDVVFLIAGQPPMLGKAAFAASQAGMRDFEIDACSEVQEIEVRDDRAYVWTKLTVVVTPRAGGAAVKRAGNTLSVLKRQGDGWVIHRDANMLSIVKD